MLSKPYSSVIVTGSIGYDEIMDFPGKFVDYFHPERLHQINVSFVVDRLERQLGGIAVNIAYNISFLTTKKITILGAVGKDGGQILNFLKKRSINVSGIIKDNRLYSSCGTVFTDRNDNQIWGYYYGAAIRAKEIKLSLSVNQNSILVIDANHQNAFLNFQKQAIDQKIDYLYDPGMGISVIPKNKLIDGIMNCRWLIGNDYEIANILRITKLKKELLFKKKIAIITTLGEKGVRYEEKYQKSKIKHKKHILKIKNKKKFKTEINKGIKIITIPSYQVKKVIDPTGAGDAWRGGFVGGLLENKPLIDCLKLGNVMASFAIEKYGTVNHRPSKKEIEKRLKAI
ncbi:hypothetical protein COS31_02920 [Candidatus Roizmanbacteria bacterium CG02_land_8_20_14_3_00_36_15]|uniref:Carbohydrate kinase PfkB domain-containing protein n=2 Tax=Candidatus Roizmaniibacteriota TaxID=1752723 RepID=A0A2M8KL50_9BACT|nr:MAG: hypothetical protein COS51_00340 [Candidatus Roizmanbacteria bacterium CG03_land_8_20_14_0_80_36_21]PIV37751.1 MAG: hypothetical protein COS31_02920 [Candidatus Roizmanbacteria bacterium CG02_land_8_20_14_3_00_36_15]PIY70153.1 MAG: hypothetical protein COY89_02600 [Candidatus Roizmanbacteria bacterium CG_4_10_14_0_8_um_filter_36_36]PJA52896.1 MAG: hypothetical protein CO166_03715 [Candidatus Roizmanbacteria bacterium CG_4_9_14_3_um_filter_36_11]PJC82310.1 MAG: hypothetical protein CO007